MNVRGPVAVGAVILGSVLIVGVLRGDPERKPEVLPWLAPDPVLATRSGDEIEVHGQEGPTNTMVIAVDDPPVPSHQYLLKGQIRYAEVAGVGHLEMWSTIPGKGSFFTKTLADSGAMGRLTGTSAWRDVELPFFSEPGLLPERITVSVVLPGKGTVWLKPFTLTTAAGMSATGVSGGWLGGIVGVIGGTLGGAIGVLASMRKTRPIGLYLAVTGAVLGAATAASGLVLLALGNSREVWYPLLLGGGLVAIVLACLIPRIRGNIAADELRHMRALDVAAVGRRH